jgi:hypothetical protein
MTQPIEISRKNWLRLQEQIRDDYPISVSLIRGKMKKVLGFTTREYTDYSLDNSHYIKNCIMLDFFSEKKRTFFIMKYGDYLNER